MTVVYCLDKNLYAKLPKCIRALVAHNNVDKIHVFVNEMMTPDLCAHASTNSLKIHPIDEIKEYLPFNKPGISSLGIMTYARLAISKVLEEDKILYMDVDTLVRHSLKDLWNTDISNVYVAGVIEPEKDWEGPYLNAGVLLMNLKNIRNDKMDDLWIDMAKSDRPFSAHDQDIINSTIGERYIAMSPTYNSCSFTTELSDPVIVHGAGGLVHKLWNPKNKWYTEWLSYGKDNQWIYKT